VVRPLTRSTRRVRCTRTSGSNMLLRLHQIDKFYTTGEGPLHVLHGIDLSLEAGGKRQILATKAIQRLPIFQ
jgi:hypothetical protein